MYPPRKARCQHDFCHSARRLDRHNAGTWQGRTMTTAETLHRVDIDERVVPNRLTFSPVFNVAVPFIDRHVAEGRGERVALRHKGGDVTYAQLADNVSRAGNALL